MRMKGVVGQVRCPHGQYRTIPAVFEVVRQPDEQTGPVLELRAHLYISMPANQQVSARGTESAEGSNI